MKTSKLVHFRIAGGNDADIRALSQAVKLVKKQLPEDMEFIVTNDKVELRDVKYLIEELYNLYNLEKTLKEKK